MSCKDVSRNSRRCVSFRNINIAVLQRANKHLSLTEFCFMSLSTALDTTGLAVWAVRSCQKHSSSAQSLNTSSEYLTTIFNANLQHHTHHTQSFIKKERGDVLHSSEVNYKSKVPLAHVYTCRTRSIHRQYLKM